MVENNKFLLKDWTERIENNLGNEQWITIYSSIHEDSRNIVFYSALVPEEIIKSIIERKDYSWDLHIGDGRPGFNFRFEEGKPISEYCQYGNSSKIQPLIINRNYYGIKENKEEIAEEFRLYFNLYYDDSKNNYVMIKDDGSEEDVVRISTNEIKVNAKYIKEFIAAKKMKLAIYFDMISYSDKTLDEQGIKKTDEHKEGETYLYHYVVSNFEIGTSDNKKAITSIIGKIYISGLKDFKADYLPNTDDEKYEEFTIGVDEEGKDLKFSCDHKKLANYFGANPDNPHYVTPVFFDRKVLARYYDEPSKYSIKDGYLSCGALWSMRIDNNHEKYVIAYLGDLGRDLPESHRKYWQGFNVPPDGGISEVQFRRGFLAQFTDPSSSDLIFKQKLKEQKKQWSNKFGWNLLKDLNEEDKFHLIALRIPMKDEQLEFDSQIQSLTKILIDSINESKLKEQIVVEKNDTGITKLEKFFLEKKIQDYEPHIKFLRSLQYLRSKGVAHRKGKEYKKEYTQILLDLNIKSNNLSYVFRDLLNLAINFLDYLVNLCK